MSRRSDGAFDITVGPLVQVWRRARRQRELPTAEVVAEAKARVGWQKVVLDPRGRTAKLLVPGMRLDFGSIAKGRALDEALRVLRAHGITRALVTGSGDMAIGDPPPDRTGWRIELAPLDAPGAPPTRFLSLRNCGFATSGDLFQHVELGGKRYSHIVDPRTGLAMTDHSLVTVIARDCVTANSLSTTTCVVGPERGLTLVAATPVPQRARFASPASGWRWRSRRASCASSPSRPDITTHFRSFPQPSHTSILAP